MFSGPTLENTLGTLCYFSPVPFRQPEEENQADSIKALGCKGLRIPDWLQGAEYSPPHPCQPTEAVAGVYRLHEDPAWLSFTSTCNASKCHPPSRPLNFRYKDLFLYLEKIVR